MAQEVRASVVLSSEGKAGHFCLQQPTENSTEPSYEGKASAHVGAVGLVSGMAAFTDPDNIKRT